MKISNTSKGIFLIVCAAFSFAAMNTFVKLAGDLPFLQKAFFRNIIPFLLSSALLLRTQTKVIIHKKNIFWLILRSTCGTLGVLCNFYAVDRLILSDASILAKLAPFFAIIMSFFILREKVNLFRVVTVILAFIGSIFIVNPDFNAVSISIPALISALGALAAGTAYTIIRKLGERGQDSISIIFFFAAFSTLVVLPSFIINFQPMDSLQFLYLILAGICATIAQFSVTNAYMFAPAKKISVYDYSQVLFAAIFGYIFYSEIPTSNSIIGYVIITGVGIASFLYSKKKKLTFF